MDSKARILVVDDNRSLVRVLERLLEKNGFQVITAFDGLQGLQRAREEKPDLVILDIVMPEMDGYEVCRHLQCDPDTARIAVLMLTQKGRVDDYISDLSRDLEPFDHRVQERIEGFEAGALDFLSKPVTARELLNRVSGLLWLSGFEEVKEKVLTLRGDCQIVEIELKALETCIQDIISVRTSAYEERDVPKSQRQQQREAVSWLGQISGRRYPAIFVAKKGSEIIGYLWGCEGDERNFHISDMGVRQDFKRQGIGRALLRKCEEVCRSRGYQALSTTTYNRFRGMLILSLQEGFDIEGVTWMTGASELKLLLRKELR